MAVLDRTVISKEFTGLARTFRARVRDPDEKAERALATILKPR
jgi:hypothetical protein